MVKDNSCENNLTRASESGNVMFYILIAVALLAALSYAVSHGSRGGTSDLTDERAKLMATEIIEYGNVMASAVSQLRLRGVDIADLCFDDPAWGASDYDHAGCTDEYNKIFDINGGGLIWDNAPQGAMDSSASPDNLWHIYGDNEVKQVGTDCGAADCAELLLITDELSLLVCEKINELLGITAADTAPPMDSDYGTTRYIGALGYAETIGDEAGGTALIGKPSACFENTTSDHYAFYKVLITQ